MWQHYGKDPTDLQADALWVNTGPMVTETKVSTYKNTKDAIYRLTCDQYPE